MPLASGVNSTETGALRNSVIARLRRPMEITPNLSGIDAFNVEGNSFGQYLSIGYWGEAGQPLPTIEFAGNVADTDTDIDGIAQRTSDPTHSAAGLETFTGKDTAGAIAEVRAGAVDTAALLQHLREGLD